MWKYWAKNFNADFFELTDELTYELNKRRMERQKL